MLQKLYKMYFTLYEKAFQQTNTLFFTIKNFCIILFKIYFLQANKLLFPVVIDRLFLTIRHQNRKATLLDHTFKLALAFTYF